MRQWVKEGSAANEGKLKTIFCLNKNSCCFSCQIYLKPVLRLGLGSITLLGCLFKENDKDFMIVDEKNIIVAAGNNFTKLLGPSIINLPVNFICDTIPIQ